MLLAAAAHMNSSYTIAYFQKHPPAYYNARIVCDIVVDQIYTFSAHSIRHTRSTLVLGLIP